MVARKGGDAVVFRARGVRRHPVQAPSDWLPGRAEPRLRALEARSPGGGREIPLFQELRALGITEYALQLVPFSKGRTDLQGAALSMATDRAGGFSDAEIEEAARILPALSLVAYRIGLLHVATETLGAYLGPQTGARVLPGEIRRGDSQVISAALLLADLRGFTALVDRARGTEIVGWLNQHLECIGDAVAERNGEVLKFLGDGILAVFPAAPIGAEHACAEAVRAAIDACGRNAALNARRAAEGGPALDLTIVSISATSSPATLVPRDVLTSPSSVPPSTR